MDAMTKDCKGAASFAEAVSAFAGVCRSGISNDAGRFNT